MFSFYLLENVLLNSILTTLNFVWMICENKNSNSKNAEKTSPQFAAAFSSPGIQLHHK